MENIKPEYVCTPKEAWELINSSEQVWISNCLCRERKGPCQQSKQDVCIQLREKTFATNESTKIATIEDIKAIFAERNEKHLVIRPFRNPDNLMEVHGICFCCQDCCGYFRNPNPKRCAKGNYIEETDIDNCIGCGECTQVCYFDARHLEGGHLQITKDNCYGCNLCEEVCPQQCIRLMPR